MNKKLYGILICFLAATLWGITGNFAEYLIEISKLPTITIVRYRLVYSGIILFIYSIYINGNKDFFKLLKDKKALIHLLIYSIIGILGLQLSFYYTLDTANAAFATLIQFLTTIVILFYTSLTMKKFPRFIEILLTIIAIFSMFLLITNGNINSLKIPYIAIIWGLISVFAFSFYIIYIKNLFLYKTSVIVGLGMIISGIILSPFANYSLVLKTINPTIIFLFLFSVIFGTVIPFYLFLESLRYISPKLTSILSAFEPLSALIFALFFMNLNFEKYQILGSILLIISITIISVIEEN